MAKEGKPGRKPGGGGKVVTDSRFAAVHHDPRFQRFPKAKAKVEIDERFAGEECTAKASGGSSLPSCKGSCTQGLPSLAAWLPIQPGCVVLTGLAMAWQSRSPSV